MIAATISARRAPQLTREQEPLPKSIGRHEILGRLGAGGSSDVLLARTRGPRGFTRLVAIKRLRARHAGDPAYLADFAREATAYARLDHPAIVHLFDFVEHDGRPALVLQYVDGLSLHQLRHRLAERREGLGDATAMYVMHHVFAALAAAHEARDPKTGDPAPVVHRDVTPGNVLVDWRGDVLLTDFGLAKLAGVDTDTALGLLKGTCGYMAPEQVVGGAVTARTDVYLACLLLRELLLRRKTFDCAHATELEIMADMAQPALAPIEALRSGVPRGVCEALRVGLRREAEGRRITAAEIRDVLAASVDLGHARARLATVLATVRPPRALASTAQSLTTRPRSAPPSAPPPPARLPADTIADPRTDAEGPRRSCSVAAHELPPRAATPPSSSVSLVVAAALAAATFVSYAPLARAPVKHGAPPAHAFAAAPETRAAPRRAPRAAPSPAPATATDGALVVPATRDPHRVYVDGVVVGSTRPDASARFLVRCGPHVAKVGSHGAAQAALVPCGGDVALGTKW